MAYDKQSWKVGDPITQEKMTHIEDGIGDAANVADTASARATSAQNTADEAKTLANQANNSISNIQTGSSNGQKAWQQLGTYLTISGGEVVGDSLGTKLTNEFTTLATSISANTTNLTNLTSRVTTAESNIRNAAAIRTMFNGRNTETLSEQIADLHDTLSTANSSIGAINTVLNPEQGTSITKRLADLDGNTEPSMTVPQIITELTNARGTNAVGGANADLDTRLDAIDGGSNPSRTLSNVIEEVEGARGGYDSVNARLDKIDATGSADNRTHNYRITAIESEINAARNGEVNLDTRLDTLDTTVGNKVAKNDIKKTLTYDVDDDTVLQARQGKILNDSINTVAAEVTSARTSSVVRTPGENEGDPDTDTTYNSLDERLEAIESNAAATATNLRTDLNTIANELAMLDNGTIVDTNTKIDNLEADVQSFAAELSMTRDENTGRLIDTNTKVDELNTRIGTAETDIDNLEAELDTATTGVKARITALETSVNDTTSGLAATKAIADSALTKANAAATAEQVDDLSDYIDSLEETKTGTVIMDDIEFDAEGKPTGIVGADENTDYLFKNGDKYYYWKYIKTGSNPETHEWALISGGGGSGNGNTTGVVYTAEEYNALEDREENTDYYVLENDGYHHYRYVGENEIEIGVSKKYNAFIETIENEGTTVHYFNLYEFNYGEDDTVNEDNIESLYNRGKRKVHLLLPATGGGGGIVNNMKILPVTPRNTSMAFNSSVPTKIRFFFTTGEANEPASYNFTVDGTTILNLPQAITSGDPANKSYSWPVDENEEELSDADAAALGFYSIDISNYCNTVGTHTVRITVALDSNSAITVDQTWTVTTFNLAITSNFTNNPIYTQGDNVIFTYIPSGNVEKVAHFKLDNAEIGTVSLTAKTNTEQRYTINSPSTAGAHKLEVYLTANNGATKSSSIYRDIIWQAADNTDIIIASPYRGNTNIRLTQYELLAIPYTIVGGNNRYTVEYYIDDMEHSVNEISLINTNAGQWNYRADIDGEHTLMIKCGSASITFGVNVQESLYDIAPVDSLTPIIDFNPSGITNTSSKRLWTNGTYSLSVSDNFDWYNGGYGTDVNGDYFLVKAGTRAVFNYKMFKGYSKTVDEAITTASTVFRDGQEMKIIFKTSAVRSADAVWFTNMAPTNDTSAAKNVGIQLNVHNGWLKTDSAQESTKSYLYFPYSEEDRIELDININPDTAPNAVYIMSYEDGCPSRAYPYKTTEALYQYAGSEAPITIGSDDCDVYIYRLRIYDSALDTEQVLRNFIADGKDVTEKLERYTRNSIYYDTQTEEFTPYTGPDTILDPERLAQKIPDVKILMLEAPRFTTEKKDFVANSTLRCIHAPGGKIYPSRGKEDNWFFGNGYHSGQGTTSDKYGDAGRNIDFLFNCDGIHNPSDKVTPGKGFIEGYQSYVIKGYGTEEEEEPEYCSDWKGDDCKVSLTSTSIPNNFFNLKVNIASSENVNNALFQKRFNDFLKDIYESPAYKRDNRIKNDMEFVPAILFLRETDTTHTEETVENKQVINYTNHKEFNDTEWHFYALGNIGDSKKTDYTRAYDPTDMNEFTLEISDNNTNNSQFQTGVYMKNGVRTIEGYTVEQDYDEEKQKYKDTYSAVSSESDITVLTTDYLYPIDRQTEWEAVDGNGQPLNMRYWGLMNEKFDGDHSFEMRYACKGDYRDGKVVNDTTGQADSQLALNTKVWQSFYTWLVTSTDQQFIDELDLWCVRQAVAYFYAFTHYYTMIDNRAKNTFWHFAKTGTRRAVPIGRAFEGLMHIYEQDDGEGEYEPATAPFDNTKQYYTQYAFDMWAYDMDTAAGIDNNGELIFPYGKEDTDYRVKDDPSSGRVYNGAGSVFWARLRQNCNDAITAAFTGVSQECFNADNLIVEFDKVQNCYPEAIWRLDVERKYIRPFTGDTEAPDDNPYQTIALTRQNSRFLGDMMQGRKKYQRRQWIKNQDVYFGSKYMLSSVSSNQFDMVCYTIADQNVKPNWDVTITPYQDMYLNVDYGENAIRGRRAYAGIPIEIKCPFTEMNESRLRIYGADYIQALAGKAIRADENDPNSEIIGAESLASLYFRGNDFSHANKLRELIIGSSDPTYNNSQFTTLNISNKNPNLELLDIQNCSGLGGAIDLTQSTALKTVRAQGTSLTQVNLPSSTGIINLYLPTTITRLALTSAKNLTNLTIKASTAIATDPNTPVALSELIINDSDYSPNINWMSIAESALSHLTNLQLLNLNGYSSIHDINEMEMFVERKNALGVFVNENGDTIARINLNGTINITGTWSEIEVKQYAHTTNVQVYDSETGTYNTTQVITSTTNAWPDLILNARGTRQTKYEVLYYVDNTLVKTLYINEGSILPDIYANGTIEKPTKPRTARETYEFGIIENSTGDYIPYSGWKLSSSTRSIYEDGGAPRVYARTIVEAVFISSLRKYQVRWYLDSEETKVIKTSESIDYGAGETLEAPTIKEIHDAGFETCSVTINGGRADYSLVTGWEKLPTNINPTAEDDYYKIHAVWETGSELLDNMFSNENLSNLTPEQLLVLSSLDAQTKQNYDINSKIGAGTRMTYSMGSDNTLDSGVTLVNNVLQLDSAIDRSIITDIQPLRANNDAFTIAIDYCFNVEATQNLDKTFSTLVSCYYSDTNATIRNGFSLFYGKNNGANTITGPRVGFGDVYNRAAQSVQVGNDTNLGLRNMIVLRHSANSSTLYVYSGLSGSINLPSTVQATALTWDNYNSDAHLCFGTIGNDGGINDSIPNEVRNGKGKIYWAKYWPEDLGIGECKRLASWPHENVTFGIYNYNTTAATTSNRATSNASVPSIRLATLNTLSHGVIAQSKNTDDVFSWPLTNGYTVVTQRILQGLPIKLQSILCKMGINYTIGEKSGSQGDFSGISYNVLQNPGLIRNYIATYSIKNISNLGSPYSSEDNTFPWYDATNVTAYTYSLTNGWQMNNGDLQRANYTNIRFSNRPINAIFKVFRETTDAVPTSTTFMASIGTMLNSGDIYITTGGQAYMYVTTAEASSLGLVLASTITDSRLNTTTGGWIRADEYWTRSVVVNNGFNFSYVHEPGNYVTDTTNSAPASGLKLSYLLAI